MPDFSKATADFHRHIGRLAFSNAMGASERPFNPYAPCWCDSGKKWKFCHKDRHLQKRISHGEFQALVAIHRRTGECQHPSASADSCSAPQPIQSHTIQKRGGLHAVSENGHVYSVKRGFADIRKDLGTVDLKTLGVRAASTFPGFCNRHDTELFRPVEIADAAMSDWNAFLLSFRAIAYELAAKITEIKINGENRAIADAGAPFPFQVGLQNYLRDYAIGLQQGLAFTRRCKAVYDEAFLRSDLSKFSYYAVEFEGLLPFVAAGAFLPEFDFRGEYLQSYEARDFNSQVALNITQLGEGTVAVFGWIDGVDTPAARFVESFKSIPDEDKAHAILVAALEYLENFYCRPSWWERLPPEAKALLHERIAGGLPDRAPDCLVRKGELIVESGLRH